MNRHGAMNYFYGPVPSRRLGFSLGLDLFSKKTCSFDCLYCQLGESSEKQIERFSCVNLVELRKELQEVTKNNPKIDYITISGQGEPTLHKNLDKIISAIKKVTRNKYPVCVITNSSLLHKKEVREELKGADLIIPSLDAATCETFNKINRPYEGLTLEKVIAGIIDLRKNFKGKIWLEIMLLKGINDTNKEAQEFKEIIKKIKPDKVQLNFPTRPAMRKLTLLDSKRISDIKKIMSDDIEVVLECRDKRGQSVKVGDLREEILKFLKVRPATLKDLENSLGAGYNKIGNELKTLLGQKEIKKLTHQGKEYFTVSK